MNFLIKIGFLLLVEHTGKTNFRITPLKLNEKNCLLVTLYGRLGIQDGCMVEIQAKYAVGGLACSSY